MTTDYDDLIARAPAYSLTAPFQSDTWRDEAIRAIAALRSERDALRKDALRYRWLRDNCQYQEGISPVLRSDSANELDAAIDADLAGAKA